MPVRQQEQRTQMDQSEQGGAPSTQEARAYASLDPASTQANWTGRQSPFEGNTIGSPIAGAGRVAQTTQVRTDEQAGTPSAAAQKAYTNL